MSDFVWGCILGCIGLGIYLASCFLAFVIGVEVQKKTERDEQKKRDRESRGVIADLMEESR